MDSPAYVVNVDGVVVQDGEYLLVERAANEDHASGQLGFPGGTVEQVPGGDDPIESTVKRELAEEMGIEVGDVEYVLSSTFEADDGTPCLNVITLCEHVGGTARPREPEEVAAVHWLTRDELANHEDVPPYTLAYVDRVEAVRGDS